MKEEKYNETLLVIIILLLVIILKLIQEKDTNRTGVVSKQICRHYPLLGNLTFLLYTKFI